MRKGSQAKRCCCCGKVTGWDVPNGKYHYGIREIYTTFYDGTSEEWRGLSVGYYCKDCTEERKAQGKKITYAHNSGIKANGEKA